jgi:hypothetical protein
MPRTLTRGPAVSLRGASTLTAEGAREIALDAYLYFYPLVSMEITRRQMTNIVPGEESGKGPMNTFAHMSAYPSGDFKGVVRPNFDTLYSSAWLDIKNEPVVVTVPNTDGRYYMLPMLDMWTDVFASPGARTTGTQANAFLIAAPRWSGKVPSGMTRIDSPTPCVWVIGRTKTDGPQDYDAVRKIQAGLAVTPLSQWDNPQWPAEVKIDPGIDMKTPPKTLIDAMPAEMYFAYAAELFGVHPPHITDEPIAAQLKRIGLEPGRTFSFDKLTRYLREALEAAPIEAQDLMAWKLPILARIANGWSMNTDTMGVYGNYYLKRAIVAQACLGANLPEDAIYPLNVADDAGKSLDGSSAYTLHFDATGLPPARAFWSITLYDSDGFQVPNRLNKFAVSSWMPFYRNADGSLDIFVQEESPGDDLEANWLPAPRGPFNLAMRIYNPKPEVLTGKWVPPPVTRMRQTSRIAAE